MVGSVTAYNPSIERVGFDRAQGRFEFDGNIFNVINLQLIKGKNSLTVPPTSRRAKNTTTSSKLPLDLKIWMSPCQPVAGKLRHAGIRPGGFRNIQVSGTMDKPVFNGDISLDGATFSQKDIKPAVTGIKGTMHFRKVIWW